MLKNVFMVYQKSKLFDLSIPKWMQVSEGRFNFIKSKTNKKKTFLP